MEGSHMRARFLDDPDIALAICQRVLDAVGTVPNWVPSEVLDCGDGWFQVYWHWNRRPVAYCWVKSGEPVFQMLPVGDHWEIRAWERNRASEVVPLTPKRAHKLILDMVGIAAAPVEAGNVIDEALMAEVENALEDA
jgi:hypothetical protein